jgi:hypothetical protein
LETRDGNLARVEKRAKISKNDLERVVDARVYEESLKLQDRQGASWGIV